VDDVVGAAGFTNELKGSGEGFAISNISLEPADVCVERSAAPNLRPASEPDDIEFLLESIEEAASDKTGRSGNDESR